MRRFWWVLISVCLMAGTQVRGAGSPQLAALRDVVYRADGSPMQGTMTITWPAFTAADGSAVAAGSLTVALGANGAVNVALAPNAGASPAGTFYRVVTKDTTGVSATEYWVVPAVPTTTLAVVRQEMMPPNIAAQAATRDYVDRVVVHNTGDESVVGVKSFAATPNAPDPKNALDVANKEYVDRASNVSGSLGYTPENTAKKDLASGYAGLDANTKLKASEMPFGSVANTVAQGNDSRIVSAAQTNAANNFTQPQTVSDLVMGTGSLSYVDVRAYGAKGDGKFITDAAMTAGSASLASNMGRFTCPSDVGRTIWVEGAGVGGATLATTIATCTDSNHVTLTASAATTIAPLSIGDAAMNSGSNVVTSASGKFSSAMVGTTIYVPGAGASGGVLQTSVASFTDANHLVLAANASTTTSGQAVSFLFHAVVGTDDAIANKQVLDADRFQSGLGKVIDGVVDIFNASAWAK